MSRGGAGDDPYERVQLATEALARRVIWEQGNRIGLLRVHAFVSFFAGLQMIGFGGPAQLEALFGPIARMILGPLAVVGGTLLFLGLGDRPRSITKEALGLTVIGIWDLGMTLGLAYARLNTSEFGLRPPWVPLPPADAGYVAPYPVMVYGGMLALIVIHLWTLRRFIKHHAPPAPAAEELRRNE